MQLTATAADETFLLDLLNSTPILDGTQQDELDTAKTGRAWLHAHGHGGSVGEWRGARVARTLLQDVVRGTKPARALAPVLERVSYRADLADDGIQWQLDTTADQAAAVRAVLAWDAVRRNRPGRLRPCENPECALFLIDHSKPNKARWCSMATCGNRMKARRHYERTRAAATE